MKPLSTSQLGPIKVVLGRSDCILQKVKLVKMFSFLRYPQAPSYDSEDFICRKNCNTAIQTIYLVSNTRLHIPGSRKECHTLGNVKPPVEMDHLSHRSRIQF